MMPVIFRSSSTVQGQIKEGYCAFWVLNDDLPALHHFVRNSLLGDLGSDDAGEFIWGVSQWQSEMGSWFYYCGALDEPHRQAVVCMVIG